MNATARPRASIDDIFEGVKRFREHLITKFGSREVAFKALDTNGNGSVSLGEIRDTCARLKIDLPEITGIKDFNKIFHALDSFGTGGLDIEDLFVNEPEIKEAKDCTASSGGLKKMGSRISVASVASVKSVKSTNSDIYPDNIPENIDIFDSLVFFRQGLVKKFGSEQLAFKALDTNANGLLSFSEVKDSLTRHNLKLERLCRVNGNELHKMFQLMDVDKSGELTFWELMHSDPYEEKQRIEAEKTKAALDRSLKKESEAVAKAAAAKITQETFIAQKKAEDDAVLAQAKEQASLPHYVLFRNFLLQRFGTPKNAMKALDTNGNGLLSLGEIIQSLQRLRINLDFELGAKFDVKDVFKILDVDSSGELTAFELFRCNPEQERARMREERKRELLENKKERELQDAMAAQDHFLHLQPGLSGTLSSEDMETIEQVMIFRRFLLDKFGSAEAAFEMLDVDGNGMLSFGELRVSLERLEVSVKEVVNENANLMNIFRKLDANKRGEISLQQLMINDPGTKEKARKKKRTKTAGGSANKLKDLDESEMSVQLLRIMAFIKKPTQTELDLRWGHIGKDGARRLARALHDSGEVRPMTLLQLQGNYITSDGLRPLADSIENFCHLERLILSWNGLDNVGAEILAFTVSKIKQLTELDLSHNHISDQGAENLARSIGNQHAKTSLKILNMESNLMGRFGIEELNYACSGKNIELNVQGNLPESTSGCNMETSRPDSNQSSRPPSSRHRNIIITPVSERHDAKSSSSIGDTSGRKQAKADDFAMKSIKVAADLRHFSYCWSADGGFSIPKGKSMTKMIAEARKEAQNIEAQRKIDEEMAMADENSEVITTIAVALPGIDQQPKIDLSGRSTSRPLTVASDAKSKSVGNDSSRSKLSRSVSQGRLDSRSQSTPSSPSGTGRPETRYRETGIALDYKQKPAGDSWKVGLELERKLRNAKLVGLGKVAPSRLLSQSQPLLNAHKSRTGAFAQSAEAWH